MDGDNKQGREFYRKRAAEMLVLADSAQTEKLRQSFVSLAANWSRLADSAEEAKEQDAEQDSPEA